jgi:hypothetical protein
MKPDPIYWLFSSSAQAIAAFIAFLLTGFAVVLQLIERAEERDNTLQPIHDALKLKYHRLIVLLSIFTGVSIVASLGMIYLNGLDLPWIGWPALVVFLLNVGVIAGAIWLVTVIIDPGRYAKAADTLLAEDSKGLGPSEGRSAKSDFINAFIDMEREVRTFIDSKRLKVVAEQMPRRELSFRLMIDVLLRYGFIDDFLYQRLLEINRSRNLIFHGHVGEVDSSYVKKVLSLHEELKKRLKPRRRRAGA